MTVLAIVIAASSQLVTHAQRRYARTKIEGHHRSRSFLETNRRYFTPAQYAFHKRQLDEEAASLGIEDCMNTHESSHNEQRLHVE